MSLTEDIRILALAKTFLNHINSEMVSLHKTGLRSPTEGDDKMKNLDVERTQLMEFIDSVEGKIMMKALMNKLWFTLFLGDFKVLEHERLCRKALDEKPFVMSYDMRKQFRTMPWHWIAWRRLKMAQIDKQERMETREADE